jgi:anti-sigma factor RsiW
MRECTDVLALLADYVDGRLPAARCQALERHLSGCASCVAAVSSYRTTVGLLRSLTEDDLPPELRLRLRAFIERCGDN